MIENEDDGGDSADRAKLTPEEQDFHLQEAKAAAQNANPLKMVEGLYKSQAIAGLVRRLQARWPGVPCSEIEMAVAKAVDAAYDSLRKGKKVFQLVGFLWKVAYRRAVDYHRKSVMEIATEPGTLERVADPNGVAPGDADDEDVDEQRQRKRAEAVKIARRLLPRLGQENVQRVMALVIDAAEEGIEDLPNSHLADVLGLSIDAAKQSKSRGLRKLERLAREEGLIMGKSDLEIQPPEIENEAADE